MIFSPVFYYNYFHGIDCGEGQARSMNGQREKWRSILMNHANEYFHAKKYFRFLRPVTFTPIPRAEIVTRDVNREKKCASVRRYQIIRRR